jgi:hypothetical protein
MLSAIDALAGQGSASFLSDFRLELHVSSIVAHDAS